MTFFVPNNSTYSPHSSSYQPSTDSTIPLTIISCCPRDSRQRFEPITRANPERPEEPRHQRNSALLSSSPQWPHRDLCIWRASWVHQERDWNVCQVEGYHSARCESRHSRFEWRSTPYRPGPLGDDCQCVSTLSVPHVGTNEERGMERNESGADCSFRFYSTAAQAAVSSVSVFAATQTASETGPIAPSPTGSTSASPSPSHTGSAARRVPPAVDAGILGVASCLLIRLILI